MRIGVVGTSWWTELMHGPGAVASPDWELTAVFGRSLEKAEALAGTFGCKATSDFDELLAETDALVFAVPPDVQATLGARAAEAGKHLLLEKPLALDLSQGRDLVAAVEAAGVANLVFFTARWLPGAANWLEATAARGGWESGRYEQVVTLAPDLQAASPWRVEHGALWDVGPHAVSTLERVLGHVTAVSAVRGVRDHVDLSLRHGELSSSAELSLTAPEGVRRSVYRFLGQQGEALPDDKATDLSQPATACVAALAELADQVRTGRRGGVDAAYGLHVLEVLTAAERSLQSGRLEPV